MSHQDGSTHVAAEHDEGRARTSRAIWTFDGFPPAYEALLNESQHPVPGDDLLMELSAEAGISERSLALDVACYDASASIPLVERFGCWLIGVDPSRHGFDARRTASGDVDAGGRLALVQGAGEAIPLAAASCDLVWCRDALSCMDCRAALRELARVTRPGGTVLVYTACATPLLEPRERETLYTVLAVHPASMDSATIEREASAAGLEVRRHVKTGNAWLQHRLESAESAFDVLSLARLTQQPEQYIAVWGAAWYRRILAWHQWPVYHALGKLETHLWAFRVPA